VRRRGQWPLATISVPSPYMVANGARKRCQFVLQELADRRGCHSGESLIARESILISRRRTAELPEAAAGIESLGHEQSVSVVPDGQHPALAGAGRGGELRPPAPEERAVVVPPDDLNGPGLVARADDAGLAGADLLGEPVRNSRCKGGSVSSIPSHVAGDQGREALTRSDRENGSSSLSCLGLTFAAPW
jgi:hypothetical protein